MAGSWCCHLIFVMVFMAQAQPLPPWPVMPSPASLVGQRPGTCRGTGSAIAGGILCSTQLLGVPEQCVPVCAAGLCWAMWSQISALRVRAELGDGVPGQCHRFWTC